MATAKIKRKKYIKICSFKRNNVKGEKEKMSKQKKLTQRWKFCYDCNGEGLIYKYNEAFGNACPYCLGKGATLKKYGTNKNNRKKRANNSYK